LNLVRAFDGHPVVEADAGGDQRDLVWDDRPVSAVEAGIAVALVVVAAARVTRPTWLLVAGLAGYRSRTYGHTATL
jgi:hypothetical protein